MEQQNDNSDKSKFILPNEIIHSLHFFSILATFKVEFLGEYHDLVIDWNDDKYICKGKQLFEQVTYFKLN